MAQWLDSATKAMNINLYKLRKLLEDKGTWCAVSKGSQSQTDLTTAINSASLTGYKAEVGGMAQIINDN